MRDKGETIQERQVLGAMVLVDAATVFTKCDVQSPMLCIFNLPVIPDEPCVACEREGGRVLRGSA